MNRHKKYISLCLLFFCMTILAGCGKEEAPSLNVSETTELTVSLPVETVQRQDTIPQEQDTAVTFDYNPGSMGIYVKADPNIDADPDVLDSITMTLSDGVVELTRHKVSDRQHDFLKNGMQVGGVLLVDIPRDMLEKAAESKEGFEALADHLGKQVMPGIYPSGSYISGGGRVQNMEFYSGVFFEKPDKSSQYLHFIYIGEKYCYDFWFDQTWVTDCGVTIMNSLSCEDIKPELNDAEFAWSYRDE